MVTKLYTEPELDALRSMPKRINNPRARWLTKPKARPSHRQRSFQLTGGDDENVRFLVYQRQNLEDQQDFSCGISYLPRGAQPLTLARYNGPSHEHGDIAYRPHIHRASAKMIATGRKAESDATDTDRFETVVGALACLMEDFHVSGVEVRHDELRLVL